MGNFCVVHYRTCLCPSCTIPLNFDQESLMPFLHYTPQFWPRVTYALLALYPSIFTVTYALLALYPSILTKSHLCPSCTIPFNLDQESLMPFLHYTLQFWPRVTYALLALYPSILTKSYLCPSCTVPFSFDQESLTVCPSVTVRSWLAVLAAEKIPLWKLSCKVCLCEWLCSRAMLMIRLKSLHKQENGVSMWCPLTGYTPVRRKARELTKAFTCTPTTPSFLCLLWHQAEDTRGHRRWVKNIFEENRNKFSSRCCHQTSEYPF